VARCCVEGEQELIIKKQKKEETPKYITDEQERGKATTGARISDP
jgi:hypothetical protein